jgi:hypothetical protein
MARLGAHYPWASPDYILRRMTWAQVWLYYDACIAHLSDKEYETEIDEPELLKRQGVVTTEGGARVYSR